MHELGVKQVCLMTRILAVQRSLILGLRTGFAVIVASLQG